MSKSIESVSQALLVAMCFLVTPAMAETISVPVWIDDAGRLRTNVTFAGGQSLPFIVDTGMISTVYLPPLREVLSLIGDSEESSDREFFDSISVVIGGVVEHVIPRTDILDMKISDEVAYGVLGLDFLAKYVVEHDVNNQVIRLSDNAAELLVGADFTEVQLQTIFKKLYLMPINSGGVQLSGFIDTGAGGTLLNTIAIEQMDAGNYEITGDTKQLQSGSSTTQASAQSATLFNIGIDGVEWNNLDILISDGMLKQIRLNDRPGMILGADMLLDGRKFIIDYFNDKAYFQKNQKAMNKH